MTLLVYANAQVHTTSISNSIPIRWAGSAFWSCIYSSSTYIHQDLSTNRFVFYPARHNLPRFPNGHTAFSAHIATFNRQEPLAGIEDHDPRFHSILFGDLRYCSSCYKPLKYANTRHCGNRPTWFPNTASDHARDTDLDVYYEHRKQRRLRFGLRWKTKLRFELQDLIEGHLELILFL